MDHTLGKRIAENRKRLGLTQDQLAEKLGITAQAISKWENDLSCPDISMLPRLAEIFGTTTDALLGRDTGSPVHTAEVVGEPEAPASDESEDPKWEFHWDAGRKSTLTFALLVLLVGVLTLISRIFSWDVSFWNILWPCALLVFGLSGLWKKFSFVSVGMTLFGGYFLVENLGIWSLNLAGELVFPVIVVLFGISLLVDALRRPKKSAFRVVHRDGSRDTAKTQRHYTIDEDTFDCSMSFGDGSQLITLPRLAEGDVTCSFGDFTVDLSGCETLADHCEIDATCSFGNLTLLIPSRYQVIPESSTAFASVETVGHPDPAPVGIIRLDASVSFGQITIHYI